MQKLSCVFDTPLTALLAERKSLRDFPMEPLTQDELGSLLWVTQGYIDENRRTTPTVADGHRVTVYVVVHSVENTPQGIYRYSPEKFALELIGEGDRGPEVATIVGADNLAGAAAQVLLATAADELTAAALEAGHAAQNLTIHARELGLGADLQHTESQDGVAELLGGDGLEVLAVLGLGRLPADEIDAD